MKKIVLFLFVFFGLYTVNVYSQTATYSPTVKKASTRLVQVEAVMLSPEKTLVFLNLNNFYNSFFGLGNWATINSSTFLSYVDPETNSTKSLKALNLYGGQDAIPLSFGEHYYAPQFGDQARIFIVEFGALPQGVSLISVQEKVSGGFYWNDIQIKPLEIGVVPRLADTYEEIITLVSATNSIYAGFYEDVDGDGYHLAYVQKDGKNYLLYVDQKDNSIWNVGEVKAEMRQTAAEGLFKCDWYNRDKSKNTNCIVSFEKGIMNVKLDGTETTYVKMAIDDSDILIAGGDNSSTKHWSGTGFALLDGYIVTNNHVIDGAKNIEIFGVSSDFTVSYKAEVIGRDKSNDLALLRIKDENFRGFGNIPYAIKKQMAEVGEDIFVLGYPLTSTMGDEIKLTNGIISSRSGFEGDVASYQISAPIQPGNSGGPMFDREGNVVGVICAKHAGAENAGYAIKMSYLLNLIESVSDLSIIPTRNTISSSALKDQVKQIHPFVFLIKCKN